MTRLSERAEAGGQGLKLRLSLSFVLYAEPKAKAQLELCVVCTVKQNLILFSAVHCKK